MNRRRSILLLSSVFLGVRGRPRLVDPVMIKMIRQELDRRFQEMDAPHVLSPMEEKFLMIDALQMK
jgi:hypothetical protein